MKRKMKTAALLALMLVIALCAPGLGVRSVGRMRIADQEWWFRFAPDGEDIYFADEDGVWLSHKKTDPVLIAGIEDAVGIDAYAGGAYLLHEEGGDWLVTCVLPDGSVSQQWLLPEIGDGYFGIAALEEHIALLAGEMDDSQLYFLDRASGALSDIEGAEHLAKVWRRDDERVFASGVIYGDLICADAQGNIEQVFSGNAGGYTMFVYSAADTQDGVVMFGDARGVYTLARVASPTEYEEIGAPSIPGTIYGGRIDGGTLYLDANHTLYEIRMSDFGSAGSDQPARPYTITIALDAATDNYYLTKPMALFKQEHPDTDVKAERLSEEELALALMSGEQYDLLYLHWGSGTERLIRADIFEDMSAYPAIMEQKEYWIDTGLFYDEQDRFVRVPMTNMNNTLIVPALRVHERHRELGIELNGKAPTYDEFRALAQKARDNGEYLMGLSYQGGFPFYQYATSYGNSVSEGIMRFDTPEFREMMTFWKEMHDEDLIYFSEDAYNDETPVLLTVNTWGERFGKSWPLHYVLDNDFLYPPTPDGTPAWNVEVYEALYMNRYGLQKELAAEFVALFMSPEVYGSYMRDWETGKSHLLREIPLYAEADQTEIQEKYGFRWSHNGRDWEYYTKFTNYDLWVGLNENAVYLYHLPELKAPFDELFGQYLKGEVDLETFIAEMEKHADLWMNE